MNPGSQHTDDAPRAPMVGDHLAMDLINTQARSSAGELTDYWSSGDAVFGWLQQQGAVPASAAGKTVDRTDLLAQAKALRTLAQELVGARKQGAPGDVARLNGYLHAHRTSPHLARDDAGALALTRIACDATAASLLGPVAEAVAQLLVEGDFARVKQCEHPDCILWFYDRTKARRRRWCSMALCGNRQKAARFRKRSAAAAPPPRLDGAGS